jgi:gas vesicle protein
MRGRAGTYMGVALMGGVIGAVVGLLLAPRSGDETRRRIARYSIEDQERLLRLAEMGTGLLGDDTDLPASA